VYERDENSDCVVYPGKAILHYSLYEGRLKWRLYLNLLTYNFYILLT